MQEKLSIKTNAIEVLDKQLKLRAKKNQYGIIVLSSATDPYLQINPGLTREILEVILKYKFPVHIITKSNLVLNDLDILNKINTSAILPNDLKNKLPAKVFITFSFSSVDDATAKIFEPGAPKPSLRLNALKKVAENNFHTGVSMMPLLPFISDTKEHLEKMFAEFKINKAKYVMPATITLFGNKNSDNKSLVLRAIEKHYPQLLEKYIGYFLYSNNLPVFYQAAFEKKMLEFSEKYKLPNRIAVI